MRFLFFPFHYYEKLVRHKKLFSPEKNREAFKTWKHYPSISEPNIVRQYQSIAFIMNTAIHNLEWKIATTSLTILSISLTLPSILHYGNLTMKLGIPLSRSHYSIHLPSVYIHITETGDIYHNSQCEGICFLTMVLCVNENYSLCILTDSSWWLTCRIFNGTHHSFPWSPHFSKQLCIKYKLHTFVLQKVLNQFLYFKVKLQ